MGTSTKQSRAEEVSLFGKIITGVNTNVTGSILLGGQLTPPADIVAVFTGAIQAQSDLEAAKTVYQQKLAAQQAAFVKAHVMEENLHAYASGAYGKTNPILSQFGFTPAKPPVKSVKVKASAAEKSAATRKARNTMGPKQRLEVTATATSPEPTVAPPVVTPPVTK
jgi:hypothetical protein